MKLNDLAKSTQLFEVGNHDLEVSDIAIDSRKCREGGLFICIPHENALSHAQQAISKGTICIVAEAEFIESARNALPEVQLITVSNTRKATYKIAKAFFPDQSQFNIAITGTNGKSSVVSLTRQFLQSCGVSAASLGTLGLECEAQTKALELPKLTTLDPISLHKTISKLAHKNVQCLVFEASSHGLDQKRLHGVNLQAAAFTNLTQDHLDYHGSMDAYFEAKSKLFSEVLPETKYAIVNKNTAYFEELTQIILRRKQTLITYAVNADADIVAFDVELHTSAISFQLKCFGKEYGRFKIHMVGEFQLENTLCALACASTVYSSLDELIACFEKLHSVTGRMEHVGETPSGAHIFVDYAHTPDALKNTLQALRHHTNNKLHVVFGCGGDRDRSKRAKMGAVANDYADFIIVTDDNPRTENPAEIRKEIINACPKARENGDREKAILMGIKQVVHGDVLLIAGKGHETGQIYNDKVLPFCDRQIVKKLLKVL